MKIIRVIFFSLLALGLIASTAFFIFFQTFEADQYLPQIIQKASFALGRPVFIGGVGLGFSEQGVTLDAGPLVIADDSRFTTQPFIKIDKACFSLDIWSLVLHREIRITGILLQSPEIHFIRSHQGDINARSFGQVNRIAENNTAPPPASLEASPSTRPVQTKQFPVTIKSIKIRDASISYIDQNQVFPLDIWLSNIDANVTDFSLTKPFQLSFGSSFYSGSSNVHGSALVLLDLSKQSVRMSGLKLETDLSRIDMDHLKGISPDMPDNPIFKNMAGVVQINMDHLDMGASQGFSADGAVNITGGMIKDLNIIKTVLSHTLGVFGGMGINVDNLLSGQLKSKLSAPDTIIDKAEAAFLIHDRTIFIDHSLVETNIFEFTAKGQVDQGSNMDMQTTLWLNEDLSAALVNELEGFKYLMDDSKRIAIGASLKGVIPHLQYKPNKDFRKKSKRALMEEGGNILGIILGSGRVSVQGQDGPLQDSGKKVKKNFKNIFKSILQ